MLISSPTSAAVLSPPMRGIIAWVATNKSVTFDVQGGYRQADLSLRQRDRADSPNARLARISGWAATWVQDAEDGFLTQGCSPKAVKFSSPAPRGVSWRIIGIIFAAPWSSKAPS